VLAGAAWLCSVSRQNVVLQASTGWVAGWEMKRATHRVPQHEPDTTSRAGRA
jgi:hypothetical protein